MVFTAEEGAGAHCHPGAMRLSLARISTGSTSALTSTRWKKPDITGRPRSPPRPAGPPGTPRTSQGIQMNRTGIEAALNDLLFNRGITLEEAADRHFTPGYRAAHGRRVGRPRRVPRPHQPPARHRRRRHGRGPRRAVRRRRVRRPAHLSHHQDGRHHRHRGGVRLRRPRPRRPLQPHRGNHPHAQGLRRRPQHRQRPLRDHAARTAHVSAADGHCPASEPPGPPRDAAADWFLCAPVCASGGAGRARPGTAGHPASLSGVSCSR